MHKRSLAGPQPNKTEDPKGYTRWMRNYMRAYRASPLYTAPWPAHDRAMLKRALMAYRGLDRCQRCREDDPKKLGWRYRDPSTKSFSIATGHSRRGDLLLLEVEKCDLLCRSCQRKDTAARAAILG